MAKSTSKISVLNYKPTGKMPPGVPRHAGKEVAFGNTKPVAIFRTTETILKEMIEMKKMLFVLLVVIMALTVVALPAQATPPENAQGLWYYMPAILDVKVVGGNTFLTITDVGNWNGTFDGGSTECELFPVCAVSEDHGTVVAYASGHAFYKGVNTFPSVTVDGKTGRLEMRVNGVKFGDSWDGHWVITDGEGELAGLRGQGTWWGPGYNPENPDEWGEIHYAGNIHFEGD